MLVRPLLVRRCTFFANLALLPDPFCYVPFPPKPLLCRISLPQCLFSLESISTQNLLLLAMSLFPHIKHPSAWKAGVLKLFHAILASYEVHRCSSEVFVPEFGKHSAQDLLWENHMEDSEKYVKLHLLQSFHASFAAGHFSHGTPVGTASPAGSVWDSGAVEETPDLG